MVDADVKKIKELISEIRKIVKNTGDGGFEGQWNTYQYVANSPDTKAWASGVPVGNENVERLNQQQKYMRQYIDVTLDYLNVLEKYTDSQLEVNNGNY